MVIRSVQCETRRRSDFPWKGTNRENGADRDCSPGRLLRQTPRQDRSFVGGLLRGRERPWWRRGSSHSHGQHQRYHALRQTDDRDRTEGGAAGQEMRKAGKETALGGTGGLLPAHQSQPSCQLPRQHPGIQAAESCTRMEGSPGGEFNPRHLALFYWSL